MPTSKCHTIKGTTRKVAPKPHSPPAAPDVAKKGRKPPRIREDIPWSPSKVVMQKLAPLPDTTIDLTHLKETSPPSSSNQASAAASTLISLVTVPVAAVASTNLYHQLYSAEDNSHKEEQLFSADDKEDDDDNDNNDDNNVHKHTDDDYDDILDMDIDSEEEFRSSFPKNQNSSKLQVKGGDQRPDVSNLSSEKEAEEVLDKWRKKYKAFTNKVNRTAVRADHEMREFKFDIREEALGDHSTQLRAMSVINASRLSAGHVFQLKGTICLRIVEEAKLRRVKIKVMRSDIENLIVAGFHFYVCARQYKKVGWNVVQAC